MTAPTRGRRGALAFGVAVSVACVAIAIRGVDGAAVLHTLRNADLGLLLLAATIGASSNLARAVRWGLLLGYRPLDHLRALFSATMIGYLANNVLPARLGEGVRVYLVRRLAATPMSRAAATVVAERVLDTLLLLGLVAGVAFFVPLPDAVARGVRILAVAIAALCALLFILAWRGEGFARSLQGPAGATSPTRQRIWGAVARFSDGLRVWRGGRHAVAVLVLSLSLWAVEVLACGLAMRSLGLDLPALAPLCVLVLASLSFVIPSAPGGLGTYELFVVAAVAPFGLDPSRALGLALVLHLMMLGTSTLLGLTALFVERLSLSGVVAAAREPTA